MLEQPGEDEGELVGGALRLRGQAPRVRELGAVEDPEHGLRVADVGGEQHRGLPAQVVRSMEGRSIVAHRPGGDNPRSAVPVGGSGRRRLSMSLADGNRAATSARAGPSRRSIGSNVASSRPRRRSPGERAASRRSRGPSPRPGRPRPVRRRARAPPPPRARGTGSPPAPAPRVRRRVPGRVRQAVRLAHRRTRNDRDGKVISDRPCGESRKSCCASFSPK